MHRCKSATALVQHQCRRAFSFRIATPQSKVQSLPTEEPWREQHDKFTIKILSATEEIQQAHELLYESYINEMQWKFDESNPSGFRIEQKGRCRILTDDLEVNSTWFGATTNEKIVACVRLLRQDKNGDLDFTRYPASQKASTQEILSVSPRLFELQRLAVNALFRRSNLMTKLIKMAAKYVSAEEGELVTVSGNKFSNSLFKKARGMVMDDNFDYGDGVPCKVFYFPKKMLKNI